MDLRPEELVGGHTQREHVEGAISVDATCFRGLVSRGSDNRVHPTDAPVESRSEYGTGREVEQHDTGLPDQDVCGLDVAMHDPGPMQRHERPCERREHQESLDPVATGASQASQRNRRLVLQRNPGVCWHIAEVDDSRDPPRQLGVTGDVVGRLHRQAIERCDLTGQPKRGSRIAKMTEPFDRDRSERTVGKPHLGVVAASQRTHEAMRANARADSAPPWCVTSDHARMIAPLARTRRHRGWYGRDVDRPGDSSSTQDETATEPSVVNVARAWLEGLGEAAGEVIELDGDRVRLGRSAENEIVVDLTEVSRTHARLEREAGIWLLIDLDSTNGTHVDVVELKAWQPQPLRNGDVINLGGTRYYRFREERLDAPEPTVRRGVSKVVQLTKTEAEVLELLFLHYDRGRSAPRLASVKEIAAERYTSLGAAKSALSILYDKFELDPADRNKEALALRAQEWGATKRRA